MKERTIEELIGENPNSMARFGNEMVKKGMEHSKSSPQTKEQLSIINTNMESFKTHLEYIKEALEKNKEEHKDLLCKIDKFIDSAEKKFASKLTEKIVYGMAGVMLLYLLTQMIEK